MQKELRKKHAAPLGKLKSSFRIVVTVGTISLQVLAAMSTTITATMITKRASPQSERGYGSEANY